MQIDPIYLDTPNKLMRDYRDNKQEIMQYFDYALTAADFHTRVNDLRERNFKREELSEVLEEINQEWDAPASTFQNIKRLKDKNSVVVIGGQQAGLLTGPMYTINKIISIVQLAKKQEKELQIPVIPVFWIAGEDHDYEEMNHIFLPVNDKMKKFKLGQRIIEKNPLSDIEINQTDVMKWFDGIFEQLQETQYTKDLYDSLKGCLDESRSYVDFFARVIYHLFEEEGLVLIDSGHPTVRQLESDYFVQLIEQQAEISSGVFQTFEQLKEQTDYTISLDVDQGDANLFYHLNNERILLVRNEAGAWVGKQNEIELTTEEILSVARNTPSLLSNNVITRPVMQELLFPSLAFIGGPGEISYWSVLKPAFQAFGMKMPIVVPRLSFTYVDQRIVRLLDKYAISMEDALHGNTVERRKQAWLDDKSKPPIQDIANDIKAVIEKAHEPIREIATKLGSDLGDLAEKNLSYLYRDIDFMEARIQKAFNAKYEKELSEFDLLIRTLSPSGGLQERIWNPLVWMNEHGIDFIRTVTQEDCPFEQGHFVVYF